MKKLLWVISLVFFYHLSEAQNDALLVHGTSSDLFLIHTVTPKENWYSVGRLFNASPKDLPDYNGTSIDKGLDIGQVLKIPLRENNFSQDGSKGPGEVLVPVYYGVRQGEWLYRVSVDHNKVPIENLQKWNNITNDDVKPGMKLIVGFLKVKSGESALAAKAVSGSVAAAKPPVQQPVATTSNNTSTPPPAVKKEETAPVRNTPPVNEVAKAEPATPVKTTPQEEPARPVVREEKPVAGASKAEGGYFKNMFHNSNHTMNGVAATFKSTSGWQDGKYYALMNGVPVGTIVRINFPSSQKNVYVKVLGELPDMKESTGLLVRLSDAAAEALGAGNARFSVEITY